MLFRKHQRNLVPGALRWLSRITLFIVLWNYGALPFLSNSGQALAATTKRVTMSAIVGYAGYYSKTDWVPVNVYIRNDGAQTSALLMMNTNFNVAGERTAGGQYQWAVKLLAHQDTQVQIAVPGSLIFNGTANLVCKIHVSTVSSLHLTGNPLRNVSLTAVLSSNPQAAQFLTGSSGPTGNPVLPVAVPASQMPILSNLYANLLAVVATPTTLRKMSSAQQQALLTWIRLGGMLLVTGTDSAKSSWTPYLPVVYGTAKKVTATGLKKLLAATADSTPTLITNVSGIKSGAKLLTPGLPLIGELTLGRGHIIQTGFSPLQSTLLGWSNNPDLWTEIVKIGSSSNLNALPPLLDDNGILSLASASDVLQPLRIPSLQFWSTGFILYCLLVGPILFVILRRIKREHFAWVILPTISIIATLGIYIFGALQRPAGILTEGVGVIDLAGNGYAEDYGIRSFMSPFAVNTSITTHQPMLLLPLAENNVRQTGSAYVTGDGTSNVSFYDVGRYGVRYVYAAGSVEGQGDIHVSLNVSPFGKAEGRVINQTHYTLHAVALCFKGVMLKIGDMKPGESVMVNQQIDVSSTLTNWLNAYTSYNPQITRGLGRSLGGLASQLGLLSPSLDDNTVMVVATTEDNVPSLPRLQTPQLTASQQTLVLVRSFGHLTNELSGYQMGVPLG